MKKLGVALLLTGVLISPARAETVTYLHTDLLGSVVLETDQNRNVVQRYEYEPYGLPRQAIADAPGYTGHVHDAGSGLVYMQQRYYDPEVGQFLSVDPVGVEVAAAANFNRYWYGNNNPYTFVDPDGRDSFLVSRRLDGWLGGAANHNFIVHHADAPGDPNGVVRSFGDLGNDTMGEVSGETPGFSANTSAADQQAWESLSDGDVENVTFRPIDASDDVVKANADDLVGGAEYSAVPSIQGGVNSNSAAGAIAQRSDGGSTSVENGRRQPGSEQSAVNRVEFRESERKGK